MMKNVIAGMMLAAAVGFGFACSNTTLAAEVTNQDPMNWEISMMPKQSEEEKAAEAEAARWSVVVENNIGVYAYDMDSLTFSDVTNGVVNKNIVTVLTKTVFTDKNTLKKINEKYKDKLAKKEKAQYCEIVMTFNLADKTYAINQMDVFGDKKTLLDHSEREVKFVPVPEGSFAEAMMEICQKEVDENAQAETEK